MNDRFKFRVWQTELKEPKMKYNSGLVINNNEIIEDGCVVMQCTGLKDKNGKLIYEGDVVEDVLMNKFVVSFNKKYLSFLLTNIKNEESMVFYPNINIEVIGNVYENKELLDE